MLLLGEAPGFWWSSVNRNVSEGNRGREREQLSLCWVLTLRDFTSTAVQCPVRQVVTTNRRKKAGIVISVQIKQH